MISLIFYAVIFLSLTSMIMAVGLSKNDALPDQHIRRVIYLLSTATLLFFIEHHHGLGQWHWLWPILTLVSVAHLYHHYQELGSKGWAYSLVFPLSFLAFFSWRMLFPNITPFGKEAMTDLYFLSHFVEGTQLPGTDNWFAENNFDFYYHFFYYSLGWIARLFPLSLGETYNFAIALIYALLFSSVWAFATALKLPQLARFLLAFITTTGGSAASLLLPFMLKGGWSLFNDWGSMRMSSANVRLIGSYHKELADMPGEILAGGSNSALPELPLEFAGYLWLQADLHPPLFGFLLTAISLTLLVWLLARPTAKPVQAPLPALFIGACTAWVMVSNTWIFPAQALLMLTILVTLSVQKRWQDALLCVMGALVVVALTLPILQGLAQNPSGGSIILAEAANKTPLLAWLFWWPLLLLSIVPALLIWQRQLLARLDFLIILLCLLSVVIFTWFYYINDPYSGLYARFNTNLKFWSWANFVLILALGMACTIKHAKWPAYGVLVFFMGHSLVVGHYLLNENKSAALKLDGHHWFTSDPSAKALLTYLSNQPKGIVIESFDNGRAYSRSGRFATFTGNTSLLNWPGHQGVWRGGSARMSALERQMEQFYQGQLSQEQTLHFLQNNNVSYVLWTPEDVRSHSAHWSHVNQAIERHYQWVAFYDVGIHKVGLWTLHNVSND